MWRKLVCSPAHKITPSKNGLTHSVASYAYMGSWALFVPVVPLLHRANCVTSHQHCVSLTRNFFIVSTLPTTRPGQNLREYISRSLDFISDSTSSMLAGYVVLSLLIMQPLTRASFFKVFFGPGVVVAHGGELSTRTPQDCVPNSRLLNRRTSQTS